MKSPKLPVYIISQAVTAKSDGVQTSYPTCHQSHAQMSHQNSKPSTFTCFDIPKRLQMLCWHVSWYEVLPRSTIRTHFGQCERYTLFNKLRICYQQTRSESFFHDHAVRCRDRLSNWPAPAIHWSLAHLSSSSFLFENCWNIKWYFALPWRL